VVGDKRGFKGRGKEGEGRGVGRIKYRIEEAIVKSV